MSKTDSQSLEKIADKALLSYHAQVDILKSAALMDRHSAMLKAAAMWNIREHKLFKKDKCKSMAAFCEKHNISINTAKYWLRSGAFIARALQDSPVKFDGIITKKHIKMFADADADLKKINSADQILIEDGAVQLVASNQDASDALSDECDVDLSDDGDITNVPPEMLLLAERAKEIAQNKKLTSRKPRGSRDKAREDYLVHIEGLAENLEMAMHHASQLWHYRGGIRKADNPKINFLIELIDWYTHFTPRDKNERELPEMNYETCLAAQAADSLDLSKRPDLVAALKAAEV